MTAQEPIADIKVLGPNDRLVIRINKELALDDLSKMGEILLAAIADKDTPLLCGPDLDVFICKEGVQIQARDFLNSAISPSGLK